MILFKIIFSSLYACNSVHCIEVISDRTQGTGRMQAPRQAGTDLIHRSHMLMGERFFSFLELGAHNHGPQNCRIFLHLNSLVISEFYLVDKSNDSYSIFLRNKNFQSNAVNTFILYQ